MKECEYPGEQEKCPKYEAKDQKPGYLDLTCIHWWDKYLADGICTEDWGDDGSE